MLVDRSSTRSCMGRKELNCIFAEMGKRLPPRSHRKQRFLFADAAFPSLGNIVLQLTTPMGIRLIVVTMDVVSADMPPLLRLYVLERGTLIKYTVANRPVKRVPKRNKEGYKQYMDSLSVPLYRSKSRHIYAQIYCPTPSCFTRLPLMKLDIHFFIHRQGSFSICCNVQDPNRILEINLKCYWIYQRSMILTKECRRPLPGTGFLSELKSAV